MTADLGRRLDLVVGERVIDNFGPMPKQRQRLPPPQRRDRYHLFADDPDWLTTRGEHGQSRQFVQ
ncbi:hypothetical protein [Nocardia sp. NPDC049149]|uniref:hypothetical protein n=1 Tax=Nocardia sp. NPDC049149 TaxID=3364315 RepID=UPI0037208FF1